MQYRDRWKPRQLFRDTANQDPAAKRAREMAGLMNTGAGLAPGVGTALGALGGGVIGTMLGPGVGTAAGAGIGGALGGAAGSLVGAGLQHGANEQTRPYEEAEMKKIARQEAVQRLLGRYLP
jgi:uncharacterized protein YcfJ